MSKSTKIIIISILCALLLLIVAVACVFAFMEKDGSHDIKNSSATLKKTPDYGQNYINSMIFIGDSTIHNMLSQKVLDGKENSTQVWCGRDGSLPLDHNIDKATIYLRATDEEMLISQALADRSPRYVVITLGHENGVEYCDEETFVSYYKKLIDEVQKSSPDTKIMLQSIFPVTGKFQRKNPQLSNNKIDTCNGWICKLAEDEGVKFLNTAEALKDNSGRLKKEYATSDGGNLNADGYRAIFAYIREHGYV